MVSIGSLRTSKEQCKRWINTKNMKTDQPLLWDCKNDYYAKLLQKHKHNIKVI